MDSWGQTIERDKVSDGWALREWKVLHNNNDDVNEMIKKEKVSEVIALLSHFKLMPWKMRKS